MEIRKYIVAAAAAATVAAASAQDAPLRGTVNVDGKYLPDVIRQDRINTLPRVYTFPMEINKLAYEQKGVSTPFRPSFTPLPAIGWRTDREYSSQRGYVDLTAGSWLNASLSAGYTIINDADTQLGVWLQHSSSSLFKPKMADWADDVKRRYYDENVGVNFTHSFEGAGRLSAKVNYHLSAFNYYGVYLPEGKREDGFKAPTQTLNDIFARVGWNSPIGADLQYDVAAGVRYFGYRRLYLPDFSDPTVTGTPATESLVPVKGERETNLFLKGGVAYSFDDKSTLGITLGGDYFGYSKSIFSGAAPDDYGNIALTPYYSFRKGMLDIRLGAEVDITANAGPDGDRFSAFHIAPDVRFDFKHGPAGVYLAIGGGVDPNSLASMYDRGDYYGAPALRCTNPTYSPFDGKLGINFGPFLGLSMGVDFAYKYARHYYMPVFYTRWLNAPREMLPGNVAVNYLDPLNVNLKGWSFGAHVDYKLSDVFTAGASLSYQPQSYDKGYDNGIDRPRWLLNANASVRPVKPLLLQLQYNYRGVRKAFVQTTRRLIDVAPGVSTNIGENGYTAMRLPDITDLYFRAAYDVTKALTISVQADNLLNRKVQYLPDIVTPGVCILGGLEFRF